MTNDAEGQSVRPTGTGLLPGGHHLMLLVRAACADDGRGGPYLVVARARTTSGTPFLRHHISLKVAQWHSRDRLVMLSGEDALAHVLRHEWEDVTDPTTPQLRRLREYAVTLYDAAKWIMNYQGWVSEYEDPRRKAVRELAHDEHRAAARSLRWRLAEQWLSRPAT